MQRARGQQLLDALRQPAFVEGRATTLFLAETWPEGWAPAPVDEAARDAVAAALWLTGRDADATAGPWRSLAGFRLLQPAGRPATTHLSVSAAGRGTRLAVESHGDVLRVVGPQGRHDVSVKTAGPDRWIVGLDGIGGPVDAICEADGVLLRYRSFEGRVAIALAVDAAAAERGASGDAGDSLRATMPGTLATLHVAEGDSVAAGQVVAVLESMKLFMELKSPATGTVKRVGARAGATVAAGDILIVIEPG